MSDNGRNRARASRQDYESRLHVPTQEERQSRAQCRGCRWVSCVTAVSHGRCRYERDRQWLERYCDGLRNPGSGGPSGIVP